MFFEIDVVAQLERKVFMFLRRLGENNSCAAGHHCPQILEMKDGNFAVAGPDITDEAVPHLPSGPGVGPSERIVKVPRHVFISATADIRGG